MQHDPAEVKAVILLQIQQVTMHRLTNSEKTLFTSGTCRVAKLDNSRTSTVYFINLNSFYYGINPDLYFIRLPYPDTVAYVFPHFENGLSAISLRADSPEIHNLDQILSHAAKLLDYHTAMERPDIRKLVQENYPQLEKEQIYYPDTIKKVITASGKLLGQAFATMGEYLSLGVTKVGNYLNTKIDQGEPTHIAPETKEKWEKLKAGTSNILLVSSEYVTKYLDPVVQKTKEYTQGLKDKIDNSQNENVKYAKELAQVSGKAIGEAFEGFVKGGTEVTKELGQQSKKLITKKYGDDVIKTLTGEEKKQDNPAEHKPEQTPAKNEKIETDESAEESQVRMNESGQNLYPKLT